MLDTASVVYYNYFIMKHKIDMRHFRRALRVLENEITRTLAGQSGCCGVTSAQCHLLLEAESQEGANLQDLADSLELDKSTLSRTVDSLCRDGLLDRRDDPANRRRVSISLSSAGKVKTDAINELCDTAYGRVFAYIPEDRHESVIEAVSLLAAAMRKSRKEGEAPCCTTK